MNKIIPLFPKHDVYVDVFCGSGVVYLNKDRAKKNIINDLDKDIWSYLKLIQKYGSVKSDVVFNTCEDVKKFFIKEHKSIADKLIYYKIVFCTGFSGSKVKKESMIFRKFDVQKYLESLDVIKHLLEYSLILNFDYKELIDLYNHKPESKETFYYLDPPYENTSNTFGYAEGSNFDFEKFKKVVDSIKGKFMLSINDSPYIRNLFKEYKMKSINVLQGRVNRNKGVSKQSEFRKELIIMNY